MPERVALVVVVAVLLSLAVLSVRAWSARRAQRLKQEPVAHVWRSLGEAPDGRRTLIAFSSDSCAACHTAQLPAVSAAEQQLGTSEVRVICIDASQQPNIARAFGVLTVPSTVVLAPAGQVVAINQGFAPSRRLIEQLQQT